MWEYSPQNRQNWYFFGVNLPKRHIPPYAIFTIFCLGEPQDRTLSLNFTAIHVALKMWPYGPQNRQKWQFLAKICPSVKKFWGSIGKLEHKCTTTNLSLCYAIITVLKIILLHSVSLSQTSSFQSVTKNRQTKNHTFSSSAGAQPRIPTILGMVIEKVRPIFPPLTFFDPISSFAARGY